jgi:hypothetical protein
LTSSCQVYFHFPVHRMNVFCQWNWTSNFTKARDREDIRQYRSIHAIRPSVLLSLGHRPRQGLGTHLSALTVSLLLADSLETGS